jgi:hypothetical protein
VEVGVEVADGVIVEGTPVFVGVAVGGAGGHVVPPVTVTEPFASAGGGISGSTPGTGGESSTPDKVRALASAQDVWNVIVARTSLPLTAAWLPNDAHANVSNPVCRLGPTQKTLRPVLPRNGLFVTETNSSTFGA